MRFFLGLLLFLFIFNSYGQERIGGEVKNMKGQALENIVVTIKKKDNIILSFTKTATNGTWTLILPQGIDSLTLEVSHISYGKVSSPIVDKKVRYNFQLRERTNVLKDVIVMARPIYRVNDTLSFDTKSFTSPQDRVIGDIIKKLPGVQIENGKILYQGKPIQKYYINGLDLLEGRYGLANDNIPADAVQKVQVIENNQPIKMLDSLVRSDRASLNIKLKKFTTTLNGSIGVGITPFLRDINLVGMTFNKNYQVMNLLKSNNIARNIASEIEDMGEPNVLEMLNENAQTTLVKPKLIGVKEISTPPLSENRWLNNDSHLAGSNILFKLKNGTELKANLSYLLENDHIRATRMTEFLLPGKELPFVENTNNNLRYHQILGRFTMQRNEKDIYLKDVLDLSGKFSTHNGTLIRNSDMHVGQLASVRNGSIKNNLSATKMIGKRLMSANSLIGYTEGRDYLSTPSELLSNILRDDRQWSFDNFRQDIFQKSFSSNNYVGTIIGIGPLLIMPRIGIGYADQQLISGILAIGEKGNIVLPAEYENNLRLQRFETYLNTKFQIKGKKATLDIDLPLAKRWYTERQAIDGKKNMSFWVSEPQATGIYQLGSNWKTILNSKFTRDMGAIETLYRGYILNSYSSLKRFGGELTQSRTLISSVLISYADAISARFFNIAYLSRYQVDNFMYNNKIDEEGYTDVLVDISRNVTTTHSIQADFSKYVLALKTLFKVNISYSKSLSGYLFDGLAQRVGVNGWQFGLNIDNTTIKSLGIGFQSKFGYAGQMVNGENRKNIATSRNRLTANVFPWKQHTLTLTTELFATNAEAHNPVQLFSDCRYRYTLSKKKIDFELIGTNLLNKRNYINYYNDNFSVIKDYFYLRPRQILASVRFTL